MVALRATMIEMVASVIITIYSCRQGLYSVVLSSTISTSLPMMAVQRRLSRFMLIGTRGKLAETLYPVVV
jgi:hypothetical protein